MIIRLRTPTNQLRVDVAETDILEQIIQDKTKAIKFTCKLRDVELKLGSTIKELKLKPGDTISVFYDIEQKEKEREKVIHRKKDITCTHDSNAMCSNCAPLDPWDQGYLSEKKIKYVSFLSYLELLKKEKIIPEEVYYKQPIINRCKDTSLDHVVNKQIASTNLCDHPRNAKCSRCQERAIALQPQIYRMIDHIEIDNKHVVDDFLASWRSNKRQKIGFLVGKICEYDHIPLGRKVKVSWIYEPEQETFPDGFVLKDGPLVPDVVFGLLKLLDLEIVGMIYTDLNEERKHFVSGAEIDFIAKMQYKFPFILEEKKKQTGEKLQDYSQGKKNKEKGIGKKRNVITTQDSDIKIIDDTESTSVKSKVTDLKNDINKFKEINGPCFNSNFVTIIITKKDSEVDLQELQVSEQAMALVASGIIAPTENPSLMLKVDNNYELFYRGLNEYNLVTKLDVNPYLPTEYFVVKLTHGLKHDPFFKSIEFFDWRWSERKMARYFDEKYILKNFSNFNVLIKLCEYFEVKEMKKICKAVKMNDNKFFMSTVVEMKRYEKFVNSMGKYLDKNWNCERCTFENSSYDQTCRMCQTKK